MNSAVDVVHNKLSMLSKLPYAVRTGGKEYRKTLSDLLDKIVMNRFDLSSRDVENKSKSLELLLSKESIRRDYQFYLDNYKEATSKHTQALHD